MAKDRIVKWCTESACLLKHFQVETGEFSHNYVVVIQLIRVLMFISSEPLPNKLTSSCRIERPSQMKRKEDAAGKEQNIAIDFY